jgi:peptidoglycan/LPS O-acetylase OafA/YrhL
MGVRSVTELLLAPLVFALLALLAHRVGGRRGVVALAVAWTAALSAYIFASVPGPEVALHSFERTPLPALTATIGGTLAATALQLRRARHRPWPASLVAMTGVYLLAAIPAGAVVLLWEMG